ncbi:MAG TPA: SIS domain-containing protein, partial [Desulfobacterales bacterium]|nr:SIS domain-containing protein [Desulfobacterales bacterium]
SQRIRLATQIGSKLSGVLYVLDEPSIGLHQRDNARLLAALRNMRDLGNTVLVVEHDEETIRASDYVVDMGPGAGVHGGEVVFAGPPADLIADGASLTGQYLSGRKRIEVPGKRRPGSGQALSLFGACANNLKHVDACFPLGCLTCVTGVSGSGKSTLVLETLYRILAQHLHRSRVPAGSHARVAGLSHLDKVVNIDQSPIGKTPLFAEPAALAQLDSLTGRLSELVARASRQFAEQVGHLPAETVEAAAARLERLKDVVWCLGTEVGDNVRRVQALLGGTPAKPSAETVAAFKNINAVLNSVDRLEVRGRDSAGISLLFVLEPTDYEAFCARLNSLPGLAEELARRRSGDVLVNRSISIAEGDGGRVCLSLVYKVAAEIGSLGDNIRFLRRQIAGDAILQLLATFPNSYHTVSAHTRWASIGAISEPNCHPVDNDPNTACPGRRGIIHACLNGDIDNYLALKARYEQNGHRIHADVTTDTKIIPLHVEGYIQQGFDVETAFRKAVSDFEGSHAISMHTDLAPGKLFLAQRGSGQAVFIGLADAHYMPTSEVYGFVEETRRFIKIDGEKVVQGAAGKTQGQVFVLDQASAGGLAGIRAMYYDGTPIELGEADVRQTEITARDIDRQGFAHYFLKEISESPELAAKTLRNRWKVVRRDGGEMLAVTLDEKTFPAGLRESFAAGEIRKVYFVGQGTAGVAALACADILNHYLEGSPLQIAGMRASELSGFKLQAAVQSGAMRDTLVVAISQSGTTTDTNRAVDMVKERGARTLGIVNRRDSDLTFKVEGVIYPSSGRDIEMSVASTKAFYSQVVAGAVLGLFIARIQGHRSEAFVSDEIRQWLRLPDQMRQVLGLRRQIEESARRHAVTRTYWAAVGSGPNKTAADEIRIKLSELCYKTISSDCIEDKKHIDLSSEPLIIVSAAGSSPTVLGDIIKDTAIFKAHKATPIVIADEGQHGFDPYAVDVFHVPAVSPHLAPILNVMAGHIWGYCAALA